MQYASAVCRPPKANNVQLWRRKNRARWILNMHAIRMTKGVTIDFYLCCDEWNAIECVLFVNKPNFVQLFCCVFFLHAFSLGLRCYLQFVFKEKKFLWKFYNSNNNFIIAIKVAMNKYIIIIIIICWVCWLWFYHLSHFIACKFIKSFHLRNFLCTKWNQLKDDFALLIQAFSFGSKCAVLCWVCMKRKKLFRSVVHFLISGHIMKKKADENETTSWVILISIFIIDDRLLRTWNYISQQTNRFWFQVSSHLNDRNRIIWSIR